MEKSTPSASEQANQRDLREFSSWLIANDKRFNDLKFLLDNSAKKLSEYALDTVEQSALPPRDKESNDVQGRIRVLEEKYVSLCEAMTHFHANETTWPTDTKWQSVQTKFPEREKLRKIIEKGEEAFEAYGILLAQNDPDGNRALQHILPAREGTNVEPIKMAA